MSSSNDSTPLRPEEFAQRVSVLLAQRSYPVSFLHPASPPPPPPTPVRPASPTRTSVPILVAEPGLPSFARLSNAQAVGIIDTVDSLVTSTTESDADSDTASIVGVYNGIPGRRHQAPRDVPQDVTDSQATLESLCPSHGESLAAVLEPQVERRGFFFSLIGNITALFSCEVRETERKVVDNHNDTDDESSLRTPSLTSQSSTPSERSFESMHDLMPSVDRIAAIKAVVAPDSPEEQQILVERPRHTFGQHTRPYREDRFKECRAGSCVCDLLRRPIPVSRSRSLPDPLTGTIGRADGQEILNVASSSRPPQSRRATAPSMHTTPTIVIEEHEEEEEEVKGKGKGKSKCKGKGRK